MKHSQFWKRFARTADHWASEFRSGQDRLVFDEIEKLFLSCGYDICFDITESEGKCILVMSPEGDPELAESIDRLIESKPEALSWKVVGGREKKDLADVCAIIKHLYLIDLRDCRFRHRERSLIEIYVPHDADLTAEEAEGMGNTFLWHAIGERRVMEFGIKFEMYLGEPNSSSLSVFEIVDEIETWLQSAEL
jgi:hypothetical protein